MLPFRILRPSICACQSARRSITAGRLLDTANGYSSQTRRNSQGKLLPRKRPAHVGPKDWRRIQREAEETTVSPQGDSAEVDFLKTSLLEQVTALKINFATIGDVAAKYLALAQAETVLPSRLMRSVLSWICRARIQLRQQADVNQSLDQGPAYQEQQAQLDWLLNDFVAKYKHIRFSPHPSIPSAILYHYNETGEFDKATKLWDWLCSMRQEGHMSYNTYAARITIAASMGEGYEVCEDFYEEALKKFGNSLVRYHLSPNAVVSDVSQPVPKEVADATALLRAMFPIKLKANDWRGAYQDLDTILRLDPRRLWASAKFDILKAGRPPWEAFLVEGLRDDYDAIPSIVLPWLEDVVQNLVDPSSELHLERLHSVAYIALLLVNKRKIAREGSDTDGPTRSKYSHFADLELLWSCWYKLCRVRGNDTGSQTGAAEMESFIKDQLERSGSNATGKFRDRMKGHLKLIAKSNGDERLKKSSEWFMVDLIRLCAIMEDLSLQSIVDRIPNWSSRISSREMRAMYEECAMNVNNRQTEEVNPDTVPVSESSTQIPKAESEPLAGFIYEVNGVPFADARYRSWTTINELFLAAGEFDNYRIQEPESARENLDWTATEREVQALENLGQAGKIRSQTVEHRKIQLDRLREFRRHIGDPAV